MAEVVNRLKNVRFHPGDILAGVTVALVLIPQALAYATLAGVPAGRGLFAAAWAPLAAALFASSPYLATGPTALTSLLTFGALSAIAQPGGSEYVLLAALLALLVGVIRIVMGLVRAGPIAHLMSQPVMLGFTAGAAVVIVASQIPAVVGATAAGGNPLLIALEVLRNPGSWQVEAIPVAIATALLIAGGKRVHHLFPGILAAVVLALGFNTVVGYEGAVLGDIESGLRPISLALPWSSLSKLLAPALVIALVGFAEPASIIVTVSDLVQVPRFRDYYRYARLQFAVALATFLLTVILAPHVERAVIIGILLAILAHLWRELRLSIPAWRDGDVLHLAPKGVLYFASAPGLEDAFGKLLAENPSANVLNVHLGGLGRVDLTGALALRGLMDDAREAGFEVELSDIPPQARKIIARVVDDPGG